MAQLGINVLDANGKLRDMGDVIEQIGAKWKGMTREQQISLAQTMAGQRQYSNLMALFENFDQYNKAMQTAANAAGTLQRQQDIYMQSTAAHLQKLKASVEDIYDSFIDTSSINGFIDVLSGMATTFAKFLDSIDGGGQLIQSLGAIAIGVFSKQIAESIMTTANNLELAKRQAEEFKQALTNNLQIQNIQGLDQVTKTLLEDQELVLRIQQGLSPDEFNGLINLTKQMGDFATQVKIGEDKLKDYKNVLNTLGEGKLGNDFFDGNQEQSAIAAELIEDAAQVQKEAFDGLSESVQNLNKKIDETREKLPTVSTDSAEKETEEYQKSVKELQVEIENYLKLLDRLNKNNGLAGFTHRFDILKKQADQLKRQNFGTEKEYTEALQQFADKTAKLGDKVNKSRQDIIKQAFKAGEFGDLKAEIQRARRSGEQLGEEFKRGIEKGIKTQQTQAFTNIVSGLGQVSMGIQQIQNLGSIWTNSELSQGQKILQTITNLSFSIPMLINGFNKLKEAVSSIQVINKASQALQALRQKNIASSVEQTAAVVAGKTAEKVATDQETQSEVINSEAKTKNIEATGLEATASMTNTGAKEVETAANLKLTASELMRQAAMNGVLLTSTQAVAMLTGGEIPARLLNSGAIGQETALLVDNTVQKGANVVATEGLAAAEAEAAGATGILNTALTTLGAGTLTSLLAVLGIAAAALAGVGVYVKIWQQQKKNAMEAAQKTQQAEQKNRQQIKSHEELYASLEDLDKQYKEGQITRAELQSSVLELTEQYGDQDQAVKKLKDSYLNLGEALEEAKKADRDNLIESNKREIKALQAEYQNNINAKKRVSVRQSSANETDQAILDKLSEKGINPTVTTDPTTGLQSYDFHLDTLEDAKKHYEALNEVIKETKLSEEDLANAPIYQGQLDVLDQYRDQIEQIGELEKENKKLQLDKDVDVAKETGQLINPDTIKSLQDYYRLRQQIQGLAHGDKDLTNDYMSKNMSELFSQYDKYMQIVDKVNSVGLNIDPTGLQNWSDTQISKFLELKPEVYNDYQKLVKVLNQISHFDFSNVGGLTNADISGMIDSATNNYAQLQDAQDKINSGKNLSKTEYQNLTQAYPELEQFFRTALDGSKKLTVSAEEFNAVLNNLKMQPFKQAATALNNELNKLPSQSTLQGIVDKESRMDRPMSQSDTESNMKELSQSRLDAISQMGGDDAALKGWVSDFQKLLSSGENLEEVCAAIQQKFKQIAGGSAQDLLQKQKQLSDQAQEFKQLMHEAYDPLDKDVDEGQFRNLVNLIKQGKVQIDDWPKGLEMTDEAIEDIAEGILRFNAASEKVSKNFDDWKQAFQNGPADVAGIMDDLADAYADLLDIDEEAIPDDFLGDPENLQLLKAAIEGDDQAYQQLLNTLSQKAEINIPWDDLNFGEGKIGQVKSQMSELTKLLSNPEGIDPSKWESQVGQIAQQIIQGFVNAGMGVEEAVKQMQALYPELNFDTEIEQGTVQQVDTSNLATWTYQRVPETLSVAIPRITQGKSISVGGGLGAAVASIATAAVQGTIPGSGHIDGAAVSIGSEPAVSVNRSSAPSVKVTNVGPKASGKTKFKNSNKKSGGGGSGGKKGGGSCFAAQTLITIPNNKYRFIEEIQVGDIVLSYNVDKNINEYSEVLQTMIHDIAQDVYHIYIENDVITATAIHPFFIIRDNCCYWIEVSELKAGDIVLFSNGTTHKISNIVKEYKEIKVYNFEVAGNHNYYVGINGILVHNKGKGKKGKEGKADTSKVHATKSTVEKADPYFKINRTLGNLQTQLKKVAKAQDKAFGKDREKQLKTQLEYLEKQIDALKKKQDINKSQLNSQKNTLSTTQKNTRSAEKQRRKQLSAKTVQKQSQKAIAKNKLKKETIKGGYGLTIDDDGEIAEGSYEERYKYYQQQIEARWKEYQAAEKIYNSKYMAKKGNADKKKAYKQNVLDVLKYNYDLWVKQLDKFKDKVQNYTEDLDLRQSLEDQISQVEDRKIQIEIEKYNAKVQLTLDLKQADREWNEFIRNITKHIDVFKKTDMKQLTLELTLNKDNLINDIDALKNSNSLINKVKDLTAKINKSMNGAKDSVYGDNFAKMEEDLQEYSKQLREALQQALEDEDAAKEAYLSIVDAYIDGYDTIIDKQTSLNDLYEYNIDLIKLVGGTNKETYEMITNQYTGLLNNQQTAMKTMKQQLEYYKAQMKVNENNPAVLAKYQEAYRNMLNTLNSAVTQSINTLRQRYENQIDRLMDALDRELSGGRALDYLDMQWELMNQNSEMYLDTVNSIYSIQSLQNKFQTAIDSTKNLKTQQRLKKVMEEQLTTLKKKDKLTQYDVDRAEKVLEVQKARMELEEAKANKTQLRLTRDSQGNYSYQFAADAQGVQDSLNKLLDAQNALYNFDKQAYQNNLNDALAAYKNFQSQYIDILKDTELSEEEKEKRITLLKEQYGQYINALTEENENIRLNLSQSTLDSIVGFYEKEAEAFAKLKNEQRDLIIPIAQQGYQSFKQLNDEEQKAINNYIVPQWSKGVETMIEAFRGKGVDGKPSFLNACSKTFEEIEAKGIEFESKMNSILGNIAEQSKSSLDTVKNGIQNIDTVLSNAADTAKKKFGPELESSLTTAKELVDQIIEASKQLEQLKTTAEETAAEAKTAVDQTKGKIVQQKTSGNPSSSTGSGSTATSNTSQAINSVSSAQAAVQQMVITNKDNQTRKRAATEYIKTHANKTSTKKSKLAAVNQKIYDKTKGKILSAAELKQLAKMLGVTYNNASSSGNLYKKLKQIGYFAKGSKYIQDDLLAWTQELGQELIYDKSKKAMLTPLGKGDKVFTAQMTDNLWKIAKNNGLNNQKTLKSLGQKLIAVNEQELQAYNKNKLNIIDILKSISNSLPNAISDKIGSLNNNYVKELASIITREIIANNAATADSVQQPIQQTVKITATFPAVNSKKEIEEAFADLVNLATQRTLR